MIHLAPWDLFQTKAEALGASVLWTEDTGRQLDTAPDDFVCSAAFAVAETGSLLVTLPNAVRRAAFLAERLWVTVRAEDIVATLDEALARVREAILRDGNRYATLMSGPSRTADIERKLTIGVHGPRALTVVVIGRRAE